MKKEIVVRAIKDGSGVVKDWWYVAKEVKPTCMYTGKWENYILVENHIDRSKQSISVVDNFVIVEPGELNNKPLKEYITLI